MVAFACLGLVFAGLLMLTTFLPAGCGSPSVSAGKIAPDFAGKTISGTDVSLSQYRGKPLVLAFMASW
jgi:cytochrome oxidase Cu insertion factor (SCO1/SenC/PrrC family)